MPHRDEISHGQYGDDRGDREVRRLSEDDQPLAVHVVRERPAEQAEDEQGNGTGQPEQAELHRRL